jgi:hypothetical protein
MKIQDLITLNKRKGIKTPYHSPYYYENQTQKDYRTKYGYCWEIPSHSQNESVLLNNYEKDCVIAY